MAISEVVFGFIQWVFLVYGISGSACRTQTPFERATSKLTLFDTRVLPVRLSVPPLAVKRI